MCIPLHLCFKHQLLSISQKNLPNVKKEEDDDEDDEWREKRRKDWVFFSLIALYAVYKMPVPKMFFMHQMNIKCLLLAAFLVATEKESSMRSFSSFRPWRHLNMTEKEINNQVLLENIIIGYGKVSFL